MQQRGQSLSEYGLVLGLVVIASIGAALLLGQTTDDTIETVASNMSHSDFQIALSQSPDMDIAQYLAEQGYIGETRSVSFTTANGETITLEEFPINLTENMETLGSNGTTLVMSQLLQNMAEQLVEQGVITAAEGSTLIDLANRGHDIAKFQEAFSDGMSRAMDGTEEEGNDVESIRFIVDGDPRNYHASELRDHFGINATRMNMDSNHVDVLTETYYNDYFESGSVTDQFMSTYFQAKQNGTLSNPAVRTVVQSLAADILNGAQATNVAVNNVINNDAQPSEYHLETQSLVTHNHSGSICTTGGGADSGIRCR